MAEIESGVPSITFSIAVPRHISEYGFNHAKRGRRTPLERGAAGAAAARAARGVLASARS
jgi:hypothetical protein